MTRTPLTFSAFLVTCLLYACSGDSVATIAGAPDSAAPVGGQGGVPAEAGVGAAPTGTGGASGSGGASGGTSGASGGTSGASGGVSGAGGALSPLPGDYDERAPLLATNSETGVAELDGKIYVVGGYPSSRVAQTTVQVYDPVADRWDMAEPLPEPLHHPVVAGVLGKLYSLGGQRPNGDSNRTLVHDPVAGGPWVDLATMPTARGAGAGAVIDDKIYVAGGRPPAGNAFEVYDVSDDAWTPLEDLPQAFPDRNHIAATAIGGKVYVAGGRYGGGSFGDPMTDSLDVYDPATGMWSQLAPMLRPRGGVNGIAAFGCFHVWGGEGANTGEPNNVFPDHDVYDPIANRWTELADLPTPIHGVTGAAFVNGIIYMPGGGTQQGGSSGSRIFQVYRPDTRCE